MGGAATSGEAQAVCGGGVGATASRPRPGRALEKDSVKTPKQIFDLRIARGPVGDVKVLHERFASVVEWCSPREDDDVARSMLFILAHHQERVPDARLLELVSREEYDELAAELERLQKAQNKED